MMKKNVVDYYYAPISGYAYLGEPRLMEIAERTDTQVRFKPCDFGRVFAESGTTAPFKQSTQRLNYRLIDMQRIAHHIGLPINPKPLHWPVPMALSAKAIYAAIALGIEPHRISFAILSAVYAREMNVSEPDAIDKILNELDLDIHEAMTLLSSKKIAEQYESATQEAIDLGVIGSPTYVLNAEEIFFGQDRLQMLEHSLSN